MEKGVEQFIPYFILPILFGIAGAGILGRIGDGLRETHSTVSRSDLETVEKVSGKMALIGLVGGFVGCAILQAVIVAATAP